jgi:hypothetical protein
MAKTKIRERITIEYTMREVINALRDSGALDVDRKDPSIVCRTRGGTEEGYDLGCTFFVIFNTKIKQEGKENNG